MPGSVRSSLALAGTAVVAAFGLGSPASAALPAECAEVGPTTVRCSYTTFSVSKEFVVPAGVTSIHAKAVGAPGRSNATSLGGRGAIVTADLPVSPGSTLTAFPAFKTSPDRGFGACEDGGGASGLRKGDLLADRILVAGGGGGAGCPGLGAPGGPGGDAGSAGGSGTPGFGGGGGGAGTQTSGGAGGTSISPAAPGDSGSFGQGDSGAAASGVANAAGGGGGGWCGGAGAFGGGGGGGGSSLVPAEPTERGACEAAVRRPRPAPMSTE